MSLQRRWTFVHPTVLLKMLGVLSGLAIWALFNFAFGSELSQLVDSTQSPDGQKILERIWVNLDTEPDVDVDYVELAIHDPQHKATGDDAFLSRPWYPDYKGDLQSGVADPLAVFYKWLDNSTVLVAVPIGRIDHNEPKSFRGIGIRYAAYPNDPGKFYGDRKPRVKYKAVSFEFHASGGGLNPNCELTGEAVDGEYLKNISISLGAHSHAIAGTSDNKLKKEPRQHQHFLPSDQYWLEVYGTGEINKPLSFVTGADIGDFPKVVGESSLKFVYRDRHVTDGIKMNLFQFVYDPKDTTTILKVAREIMEGRLTVRVGYWLDDQEIIYSAGKPKNASPFEDFERCLR